MDTLRFDDFPDDTIVLHFGGPEGSINSYTLADALIGFADMARAISATVEPGTDIELVVEALGTGSFRVRIRRIKKEYGGLIAVVGTVFWGIVSNYIYDNYVKDDPPPQITIQKDGTVVKTGKYTIVISADVHAGTEHAKKNPAVQSGLAKTFSALEADENMKTLASLILLPTRRRNSPSPAQNFQRSHATQPFFKRSHKLARPNVRRAYSSSRRGVITQNVNGHLSGMASLSPRRSPTRNSSTRLTAVKCCWERATRSMPN